MYLDLIEVLRAPGNANEKPIDIAPRTIDDISFTQPIKGRVKAINARQNIVVSGAATTAVELECARCLRNFEQPMDLELEAVIPTNFVSSLLAGSSREGASEETSESNELSEEELAALFDGHSLDVSELIRQAAVLQTPRKPLCSDDCPGLPEAQEYRGDSGDDRWNALKDWNNGTA
ncbi:MAG TPA: DUF177 domain-containing protein [Abditibacteriaceae bacterium]|jgi:uncharacterized protein